MTAIHQLEKNIEDGGGGSDGNKSYTEINNNRFNSQYPIVVCSQSEANTGSSSNYNQDIFNGYFDLKCGGNWIQYFFCLSKDRLFYFCDHTQIIPIDYIDLNLVSTIVSSPEFPEEIKLITYNSTFVINARDQEKAKSWRHILCQSILNRPKTYSTDSREELCEFFSFRRKIRFQTRSVIVVLENKTDFCWKLKEDSLTLYNSSLLRPPPEIVFPHQSSFFILTRIERFRGLGGSIEYTIQIQDESKSLILCWKNHYSDEPSYSYTGSARDELDVSVDTRTTILKKKWGRIARAYEIYCTLDIPEFEL